ncbi:MAG: glycosyltransferase [Thermodesulfobacteriota bacterium]
MPPSRPVLFRLTNNLDIGGVQKRLATLLPLLTKRLDVHVVTYRKKGALAQRLKEQGIAVHYLPIKGKTHLPSIINLAKLFKKNKATIVHTHSLGANIPGILAAALAGVPVKIAQVHRRNLHWYAKSRIQRQKQILLESCVHRLFTDKVLFVSQDSLDYFRKHTNLSRNKLQILHNGFRFPINPPSKNEARNHHGLPRNKKIIGFVGRLSRGKGLDYFLDFAQKALAEDKSLFFLIVGDGPGREEKEREMAAEGLVDNILFVGEQTDMDTWYPALDLLLFTSEPWAEGMPGVVLEACSHGLPVLARHSKTIEEIKKYYSRIIFIEEEITQIKNIKKALAMPKVNLKFFKKEFSLYQMATKTINLYSNNLKSKQIIIDS